MGLQSGRLRNNMITASSQWDTNHAAHLARLHGRRRGRYKGAWTSKYNNRYQWLQVDFGGPAKIIRISTQGRQDADQWVTQYYVSHSLDRVHFLEYKERNSRKVKNGLVRKLGDVQCTNLLCRYFIQVSRPQTYVFDRFYFKIDY